MAPGSLAEIVRDSHAGRLVTTLTVYTPLNRLRRRFAKIVAGAHSKVVLPARFGGVHRSCQSPHARKVSPPARAHAFCRMDAMRAWVKRNGILDLTEVPVPRALSDEVLVRVQACSLNRGEVRGVARAADGVIPGWDIAGTVHVEAANGIGPGKGARVAAFVSNGGWAEYVRVPARHAAVVPEGVDLATAATLPIAGLTVVRALDVAGSLVGKSVLITGASGGVGQFGVQIAARAGAVVTAVSSRASQHDALKQLGAAASIRDIADANDQYHLILESVGGDSLAKAIDLVARGGVVVTIGNSSEAETTFNARSLFAKGGASIYGLLIFEELASGRVTAADLERLLNLVASGHVHAPVEVKRPWTELNTVFRELENRSYTGKAVLTVD